MVIYYKNWVSLNLVLRAFPYSELPLYLAAADGVMCDSEEEKLVWWAAHRDTLPHWVALVIKLVLVQPSSVAAERVFSFLNTLSAQQEGALEAKHFSSPETVVVRLTRQQKARTQMTTKATGLCAKSRRLKIWNCAHAPTKNARKRPQTERNGHCPC